MIIGFAMCGSFCTFAKVFPIMEQLAKEHTVIPIFSETCQVTDSRFGKAADFLARAEEICGRKVIGSIAQAEPIGPKKLLDVLVVAPCTGNTAAKIAHGIADTPVTMAVKSHLRNAKPLVIAISTNDGLAGAAENIGKLIGRKNVYLVPFRQDDPAGKPTSLVADFDKINICIEEAVLGRQVQPVLL